MKKKSDGARIILSVRLSSEEDINIFHTFSSNFLWLIWIWHKMQSKFQISTNKYIYNHISVVLEIVQGQCAQTLTSIKHMPVFKAIGFIPVM